MLFRALFAFVSLFLVSLGGLVLIHRHIESRSLREAADSVGALSRRKNQG